MSAGAGAPPLDLMDAFKDAEAQEQVGAAIGDDGVDARLVRVLVAWMHCEHRWDQPRRPRPDGARASAASWAWLREGWRIDHAAIAAAADVSESTARAKMRVLVGCRLVYPDGTVSKYAKVLVQGALRRAVRGGRERRQASGQQPTAGRGGKPGAAN